ncbi:MAG: hypothetical protein JJE10_02165 [Thermoleophilia bacterium]|nr:hypothetical protein [Thermoleophilia bacterium]
MRERHIPWGPLTGPLLVVGALALIYLVTAPLSADHAAQTFRTELYELSGPAVWNNYWFGGHYLPTYSLLAPAVGAWIGFRLMGVLAVIGTVAFFTLIVRREWGERAQAGAIWFSVAATVSLFSGRLTFALGVFLAMATVFAAQRSKRTVSLLLAGSVGLASPVAALFLACCGLSHYIARRPDRRGLELAAVTFAVAGIVALLFPGGGDEPYVLSSFLPAFGLTLAAAALVPPDQRLVRIGLIVYAAAMLASFVIATPMGGNVNRLGVLLTGPLLLCAVWGRWDSFGFNRRAALVLLVPLIAYWQIAPVVRDLKLVGGEPEVAASYYDPVSSELGPRLDAKPARVEVLPLASHWESARVAPGLALARGWERQTDRHLNPLFYRDRLDPDRYRRWLDRLAVGYVAVPAAELDYAAETEAGLIASGLPYLREIPAGSDWRLYRVLNPAPMVERPGRLTHFNTDGFTVTAPRAGVFEVRIRNTPYWKVVGGFGCVAGTPEGWTRVSMKGPGSIRVRADFSPGARFGRDRNCRV